MNPEINQLLSRAEEVYRKNFPPSCWYGRCIFLSWYCDLGTCKFCFRSTQKHKIKYAKNARRTLASILIEALLCRKLGWRIEFLTGGYQIYPLKEMVEIIKLVSQVYGEKIWLNLGAISTSDLEKFKPYLEGVVSSIETIEPKLHDFVCPDKPIKPYLEMFESADNFKLKKSMTLVIGLGEKKEDFDLLSDFIEKYQLDRITFYALKPVKETIFENSGGPKTEDYLWWIAQTRIRFPKIEIIAGTTARRFQEVGLLLKAGANAFTKFPATRMFNSPEARKIETEIKETGRQFLGTLTQMPKIDWNREIEQIGLNPKLEKAVKEMMPSYLERMKSRTENHINCPESEE